MPIDLEAIKERAAKIDEIGKSFYLKRKAMDVICESLEDVNPLVAEVELLRSELKFAAACFHDRGFPETAAKFRALANGPLEKKS